MPTFKNNDELKKYFYSEFKNIKSDKLFSRSFMKKYTKFLTIEELLEKSNYTVLSSQNILNIKDKTFDNFINHNTKFKNWNEFINTAILQYMRAKGLTVQKL